MKLNKEKLLSETNIVDIVGAHISLTKRGKHHLGVCPFHEDVKESLNISESKQIYKCFACGEGGDSIQFLQKLLGINFQESLKILAGESVSGANFTPKQNEVKKSVSEWKYISSVPATEPNFNHYEFGEPSKVWTYKSETGKTLGFVCRFDLPDGSKQVIPMVYATNGKREEFRWMGIDLPRPVYNLDKIAKNQNATIIVVEGEKTADAVQNELQESEYVATCWIGGANGIKNVDWTTLKNRNIILWPDNDTDQKYGDSHVLKGKTKPWFEQPGNMAMLAVNQLIESETIGWIQNPIGLPHKWDAADKEWDFDELAIFINDNLTDVPKIPKPENPKLPKPKENIEDLALETDYFRFLGYYKDDTSKFVYCFYSNGAKMVLKLAPSSMSKANLITLAPLNFWESRYPGKSSKIDIDAVQNFLINQSHKVGPFKEKYIRGRGAWIDSDKLVIHTGENLIVDKEEKKLRNFDSRYVYEIAESMEFGFDNPMETVESAKLVDHFKFLNWNRKVDPYLIAGWCVIAPFCGVLNWRPHVWLTGSAGAGKSWVLEKMIKAVLGECALVVQGKTTEPGIRGTLQSDARPVLFDEADTDDPNDKDRVQAVISTARASSYSDGGAIVKGNSSGTSRSYEIRSCFLFSSIGVHLTQQSDRSRFTVLSLNPKTNVKNGEIDPEFRNFDIAWANYIADDYSERLHARTIANMDIILKNAKTFSNAASYVIGNRRLGDQVGILLAGAYSLTSEKEISYESAVKWVSDKDWSDEKNLDATKDENQLLTKLMSTMLRLKTEFGDVTRTVGELITVAAGIDTDLHMNALNSSQRLKQFGIIIEDGSMIISNSSPNIKAEFQRTAWSSGHSKILERIEGAEKVSARQFFPGLKSRGVKINLKNIVDI